MDFHIYFHADESAVLKRLDQMEKAIMAQLDDVKAIATELKKDNARMISVLTDIRQSLADANAKIAELRSGTHLSDADQATLNEVQAILTSTDDDIEAQVPEIPEPAPAEEPPANTPSA